MVKTATWLYRFTIGEVLAVKGILCIGFLKRSRQQKEITREQAVQDLEVSYESCSKLAFWSTSCLDDFLFMYSFV
ncbi:hypothetical protein ERO13_A10G179201v2 [Gossypium hirsutum]|nr:hypothetical protein ERO13_A10G179201v2 [Gossypium hirsutum]